MNRKKLRMALMLIALVLTGATFTSAFQTNQVQENILFDLNVGLVADDYTVHDPIVISSDADFASQGWLGSGTLEDPYLIEGLSIDGVDDPCIWIENTRVHFLICDCFLYGGAGTWYAADGAGIYLKNVSYGQLVNNRCTQNSEYGISIQDSQNNTLRSNECFTNDYVGIRLWGSDNNTLASNHLYDQRDSINVHYSHHVKILDNICNPVKGTGISIYSDGGLLYDIDIINNTIIGVGSYWLAYGIELRNCISSTVKNNTVKDNNDGVYAEGSMSIVIENNTIIENYHGIELEDCTDISVTWNVLNNSYNNAHDSNGLNFFDYNYWSDYTGVDEDGDGIGDTPYEDTDHNIVDNHPLVCPLGSEPTTTTDGEATDDELNALSLLIGAVAIIICIVCSLRGKKKPPRKTPRPRPYSTLKEKEITTKVMVICPFCGAKTEQGISKCQNCGAAL